MERHIFYHVSRMGRYKKIDSSLYNLLSIWYIMHIQDSSFMSL